jgi:hypothetical protein
LLCVGSTSRAAAGDRERGGGDLDLERDLDLDLRSLSTGEERAGGDLERELTGERDMTVMNSDCCAWGTGAQVAQCNGMNE